MRRPIRCAVIAGVLGAVTACGDDASAPDRDAATGGGLVIRWRSTPSDWPSTVEDGLTLESATLAVDSVRFVGDAAPGDPRTTTGPLALLWTDGAEPNELAFPDAPGGLYSQLSLLVDGHVAGPSIDIRGHVIVQSVDREYRILESSPFSLTLDIDTTLTPPNTERLDLDFDFAHAIADLDFSMFADLDGHLELDTGDPQMTVFRSKLDEGISVTDP